MSSATYVRPCPQPPLAEAAGGDDVDQIPPALLTGGGLTGVLTLLIVAFIKGWIVVGNVHREQLSDKDAQITKLWNTVESLTTSVQKYAVSAETSAHALHAVERLAEALKKRGEGP